MNIRTIVIACIVMLFLAGGVWFASKTPDERNAFMQRQEGMVVPTNEPGLGGGYGPTSTPHVTPPTAPPVAQ